MKEDFYVTCNKCKEYGFEFRSTNNINPVDFIDGNIKSDIWIIGLNPKNKAGYVEKRTLNDFKSFDPNVHQYFRDFKKVSEKIFENWSSNNSNIAHTELVKCFSETFPPKSEDQKSNSRNHIIQNCIGFLKKQILIGKPKMIICNGSPVCLEMLKIFPPENLTSIENITSYLTNIENQKIWIVLSGFIGRIDDRNKRRLGLEIENIIEKEKIRL